MNFWVLMPEIASMCVSLENESERATVIKYIFLIVFSVLPKFYVKTNKCQVKENDKFIKCPGRLFESLRYVHKKIYTSAKTRGVNHF